MKKTINTHLIHSSNRIFLSAAIIAISYLTSILLFNENTIPLGLLLLNLGIISSVGILIRQGFKWAKYIGLSLVILYLIEAVGILSNAEVISFSSLAFGIQILLVSFATSILFLKYKQIKA